MRRKRQLLRISVARALEECDPDGRGWTRAEREAASLEALDAWGGPPQELGSADTDTLCEVFAERARALVRRTASRTPEARRLFRAEAVRRAVGPALAVLAFSFGWLSDGLAPGREISLLSAPLWGLIAWNVLRLTLGAALARLRGQASSSARTDVAGQWWARFAGGVADDPGERVTAETWDRREWGPRAAARWADRWLPATAAWHRRRLRAWLHVAALVAAVGWIGSTYQRGLFMAYEASWESTWLEASTVQRGLDVVLAPASRLSGIAVPDVAPLERPGRGPAAPWIHLFALTLGWTVVAPRLALGVAAFLQAQREAARMELDWDAPYFRRRLAHWVGAGQPIHVLPYSFTPRNATLDALRHALAAIAGPATRVIVETSAPYGEAPDAPTDAHVLLPLFNLSQTPEDEVHGRWLQSLTARGEDTVVIALVDAAAFAQHGGSEERRIERRRSWERLATRAGAPLLEIGPGPGRRAELEERLEAAAGPALRGACEPSPSA